MTRQITLPMDENTTLSLKAGDEVALTGCVITGRDQACAKLFELLRDGKNLPVELNEQVMYFVGPTPAKPGQVIGSAGPTTSGRMNRFLPALLANGLRGFIGKGYISNEVQQALMQRKGVYFGAIGGTGALLSNAIVQSKVIAFNDLLAEAVHQLQIQQFPAVVIHDAHGNNLYEHCEEVSP